MLLHYVITYHGINWVVGGPEYIIRCVAEPLQVDMECRIAKPFLALFAGYCEVHSDSTIIQTIQEVRAGVGRASE